MEKTPTKEEPKKIPRVFQSPRHILDNDLFEEWEENDSKNNNNNKNEVNDEETDDTQTKILENTFNTTLYKRHTIDTENGIFTVKFDKNEKHIAVGGQDGCVRILDSIDGKLKYRLRLKNNAPVCCMHWKNDKYNTLVTASSNGIIKEWNIEQQKSTFEILEENNYTFCLEYCSNKKRFATAGKDTKIRIYDDQTKKIIYTMEKGYLEDYPGHSNRIFALKWKPNDNNIIISGGWDNTVLFWDLRNGKVFRSIYGPHIAGNCIDIRNSQLLTASWRNKETVQLWDFGTAKLQKTIKLNPPPMCYTASYHPIKDNIIAVAGTGVNCLALIDIKTDKKSKPIRLTSQKGVYCFDWNTKGDKIVFGGLCEDISVINVDIQNS